MRQGELLGLRWEDVDLRRATLTVRHSLSRLPGHRYVLTEPKTERSRRTIPLLPPVVEALTELRRAQMERAAIGGTDGEAEAMHVDGGLSEPTGREVVPVLLPDPRQGAGGEDQPPTRRPRSGVGATARAPLNQGLVFCDEDGLALDSPTVTKRFQRTLEAAGLPRVTFHSLRHSAASLMIEAGVDIATVSDILGHSTITVTVNTYTHLTETHRRAALGTLMESIG